MIKVCSSCHKEKPLSEFNKKSNNRYQSKCRECQSVYHKVRYENNKARERIRLNKNKEIALNAARQYVYDILIKNGCIDCAENDPVVLDFDHLHDKENHVSRMVHNGCSIDKIQCEIDKCVVRCANCHRRKTAKDFGWWKLKP